jgi:protein arginine N-methyltransferase 1
VVLDAGAGTGILALLAARLGAARVHAVESMPIAHAARDLIDASGEAGRVILHHADLTLLEPVEPVDVIVSDYIGSFLVDDRMLAAIEAAARWLKPGGRIVPDRVALFLAPVGDFPFPAIDGLRAPRYGLPVAVLLRRAVSLTHRGDFHAHVLMAPPAPYARYEAPARRAFDGEVRFALARGGRLRGLAGWFEASLCPGVTVGNAPDTDTHWGQAFFPIHEQVAQAGDVVEARVTCADAGEWRWSVRLRRGETILADVAHGL